MTAEAVATLGHNNPPEPTPYELSKKEIEDLSEEAKNWLDGGPIESQQVADAVGQLMGMLRDAVKTADERRKEENRPFDEGKAEVQARYNVLIGDTKTQKGTAVRAIEECKKVLQPWLDEQEKARLAEAKRLRDEAEQKAREAQEAVRAASGADFATRENAEAILRDAQRADKQAAKVENSRAQVTGTSRAISQRTVEVFHVTDAVAAVRDIGMNEEIQEAIIRASKAYRAAWGSLPAGVTSEYKKVL
ncbi:hypothetical protein [Azorhizobium caulinodans]|uniref:hypothetical protein n=1 Tax=Azorhizobium caulinodans TaxID=7 RepID=UPI002FBDC3FC